MTEPARTRRHSILRFMAGSSLALVASPAFAQSQADLSQQIEALRGELASQGEVAALERQVAEHEAALAQGLAREGLEQERRALRLRVQQFDWHVEGSDLRLRFRLSRGAFATAVLHEVLRDAFAQVQPEADE